MLILTHIQRLLGQTARSAVGPVLWVGIIGYFAYFAFYGERGLMAMHLVQAEVDQAKAQLEQVHQERARLENRSALLRPDNLDADMLDERARLMLNYSHPDDVIIMLPHLAEAPQVKTR